ncbi:MAG TPA: ATP-binding cassette domain-containing protein [Candidatus Polarisedimenticolaceae bacterium]|nr:ATP-binding cassette domain-containing protein [Candidatus Polarisedimenticolaceae bacterium]
MSIQLEHIGKSFRGQAVVRDVSLTIPEGEMFVLLGPSGSGKSTLLRIVAGLAVPDQGAVLLHGRDVTDMPPQRRGVGFVFQHYALFRHMTVGQNVEFPLRIRGVKAAERRRRRDELLALVDLAGFAERRPGELSGGQQQRVALARAIAHPPEVLLLDEPFGALDARIRTELRRTIRAIQRELKLTTIFVTHDQEEAFELADRLAVMDAGRVLESGSPRELYLHPRTEFVASFLGSANLMVGSTTPTGVRVGPVEFPLNGQAEEVRGARRVQVLFRPEDVAVKDTPDALGWPLLGQGVVESTSFVGTLEKLRVRIPALPGVRAISPPAPFGSDSMLVEAVRSQHQARRFPLRPGDATWVGVRRFHALAHPGMSFLLLDDGSSHAAVGIDVGGRLARLAQARVRVLRYAHRDGPATQYLEEVEARLGNGLAQLTLDAVPADLDQAVREEAENRPYDLLVAGAPAGDAVDTVQAALAVGAHHVLFVPGPAGVPRRVLLALALGEPGKVDAAFTGRLCRHLAAEVTVLAVLPPIPEGDPEVRGAERYLAAAARTLISAGCKAATRIRFGQAEEEIRAELQEGGHEMLVLGAPRFSTSGARRLTGIVAHLVEQASQPVLVVRGGGTG